MTDIFDHVKNNLRIDRAIAAVTGVDPAGKKQIHCPFTDHEDEGAASFTIYTDTNSFNCFGCQRGGDVVKFIELYENKKPIDACKRGYEILGDQFPGNGNGVQQKHSQAPTIRNKTQEADKPGSGVKDEIKDEKAPLKYTDLKDSPFDLVHYKREKAECAALYNYYTPDGEPHMQVFRKYGNNGEKHFSQWTWNGKHFVCGCPSDTPKYLYQIKNVKDAEVVFLVEGEKDVDSLEELGLVGTTWPGGAKALKGHCEKWDILSPLAGKSVIFIPDNDEPGETSFQNALPYLLGRVDELRKVKLPEVQKGGDVSDFIERNKEHTDVRELLLPIALGTPLFLPDLDTDYVFFSDATMGKFSWPVPDWIIEPIIPVGLTLIAGPPKARKSVFAHQLALAVAKGVDALGKFRVQQGKAMHVSLEEDPAFWNWRLEQMLLGENGPEPRTGNLYAAFRINPKLSVETQIRSWKMMMPDLKIIFLDILKLTLSPKDQERLNKGSHDGGYGIWYDILIPLKQLAKQLEMAIVVLHHASAKGSKSENKFAQILGSTALTAAPDAMIMVEKVLKKEYQGILTYQGRQTRDVPSMALAFHDKSFTFSVLGELDSLNLSQVEQDIVDELESGKKPIKLEDLKSQCGEHMSKAAFKMTVRRLVEKGRIDKTGNHGMYQAMPKSLK
jgi:AAA domain/CHC2 zinc finger